MYGDAGAISKAELPVCDFHRLHRQVIRALYDGMTTEGVPAFMCSDCFMEYGLPNQVVKLVEDVFGE